MFDLTPQFQSIRALFEAEPDRVAHMAHRVGPLRADFSKQRISAGEMDQLLALAGEKDLSHWIAKLFAGETVNRSEDRPALHMALRASEDDDWARDDVLAMRAKLADFSDHIRARDDIKAVVHIGIGGSDLGPRLIADGLRAAQSSAVDLRFAENVDGASISDALDGLDPATTLVIVVSKSFGTQETRMNAESARTWLRDALGDKAGDQFIAVTARRDRAEAFGIPSDQIFDFWDWVGGRYSVWSAVGLSLQIAYGPDAFSEFLDGAAAMDRHFATAPLAQNIPVLMGLVGIWNRHALGYDSLAIIPYARRLRKLAAFLQQLEMESNGKSVTADGVAVELSCPVIWGDEGTNGQHAFFQWLHQGTPGAPVDFVAVLADHEARPDHHAALLANCFAQSEALMLGKSEAQVREELGDHPDLEALAPQKTFPGNRPSTTITLDELSPFALGQLIALYEHKVFVQGVIWGVNSFDQWGVELGKVLATTILDEINAGEAGDHDASTTALMALLKTQS